MIYEYYGSVKFFGLYRRLRLRLHLFILTAYV